MVKNKRVRENYLFAIMAFSGQLNIKTIVVFSPRASRAFGQVAAMVCPLQIDSRAKSLLTGRMSSMVLTSLRLGIRSRDTTR